MKLLPASIALCLSVAACGSDDSQPASSSTTSGGGGSSTGTTSTSTGSGAGGGTSTSTGTGGSGAGGGGQAVPAADLLALTGSCNELTNGQYQTDDDASSPAKIPICGLNGAVFWSADMDIDCDGKPSALCSLQTDPAFQPQTSATDSNGEYLDAAKLPYVVVPLPSSRFDYQQAGLELGSVVAVIYDSQVVYGVFGDEGPDNIIGEASYAMASALGIDPDPATGGVDVGVTYIALTGAGAVVAPIEDHDAATALGQQLAAKLVADN